MKTPLVGLILMFVFATSGWSQDMGNEVQKYLKSNFSRPDTVFEETLYYDGFAIGTIQTPLFTKETGHQVYQSSLRTGYYEYPILEIAIIATPDGKIEILKSPTFGGDNSKFLWLLNDVCVDSEEEMVQITNELGNIFQKITHDGALANLHKTDIGISCDLYHGAQQWRTLNFVYQENCLKSVHVEKSTK